MDNDQRAPTPGRTQSGKTPPATECGRMLWDYWQRSGLNQKDVCKFGKVKQSAFSSYCHHRQVPPLDAMQAFQRVAGWTDQEILAAHERDTDARKAWATVGKKRAGKKAAAARRMNRTVASGATAPAAQRRAAIGRLVAESGDAPHERAARFVREVFGLPPSAALDTREGRVRLVDLHRATIALLSRT